MNLLNIKVRHRSYGVGTIIKQTETQIIVRFTAKQAKFQYPKCFPEFLEAIDSDAQKQITADVAAIEEKACQEVEAIRIAEERRVDEDEPLVALRVKYSENPQDHLPKQRKADIGSDTADKVEGEWLIACNPNCYDAFGAFNKYESVCWKQSANIRVDDIVYIYMSTPLQTVSFLCQVKRVDLPEVDIDDREFIIEGTKFEYYGRYMELRLLKKLSGDEFSRKALKEHGLNGEVQGPIHLTFELKAYLDSVII